MFYPGDFNPGCSSQEADIGDLDLDVDPVKQAVETITSDETAVERYRAGYERYVAGREAFSAAMTAYENREWPAARRGFREAEPAFADAADQFDSAARFAEPADFETMVDRIEDRVDGLQRAADWLIKSADALASGRGAEGTEYRDDAERGLSNVSDLPEPPAGDTITLTATGVSLDEAARKAARIDGRTDDGEGSVSDDAIRSTLERDLDAIEHETTLGPTYESDGVDSAATDEGDGAKAAGDDGHENEGDEDSEDDEDDEVIETLDLADPTEDESDDDTQPDWDVPGQ